MPALDFMADEDGMGSGAVDFDISSSLLGTGKRAAGKAKAVRPARGQDEGDDDDDDAAFISAAMSKQNKRAGTEVAKRVVASGSGKGKKNKVASGTITGGGSFQSMGEGILGLGLLMCKQVTQSSSPLLRHSSITTSVAGPERLHDTDTDPEAGDPLDSR